MYKKRITTQILAVCFMLLSFSALAQTTDDMLNGADKYKTAKDIAEEYNSGTVNSVVMVQGNSFANACMNYPDAYPGNGLVPDAQSAFLKKLYAAKQQPKVNIFGGTGVMAENTISNVKRLIQEQEKEHNRLFDYLSEEANREVVIQRALQLNYGQHTNACVYFVAEALRRNGVNTPDATCNTIGLIAQLEDKGWTRSTDYKSLRPGDICFTMDQNHGKGAPAHSYVFMSWVSPDNYDYAMICDNQADRYGAVYHKRNIVNLDVYKGEEKEPFHFFMRK